MSGFNIKINSKENTFNRKIPAHQNRNVLINDTNLMLEFIAPEHYPLEEINEDDFQIFIEGYIYNRDNFNLTPQICSLVESNDWANLAKLTGKLDGEFVILCLDKKERRVIILNDSWGRLPLYKVNSDKGFLLTRNAGLLNYEKFEPNQVNVAINLLFGFSLGNSTIWNEVTKIPPHSIITCDLDSDIHEVLEYFQIGDISGSINLRDGVELVSKTLDEAIESRIKTIKNPTISLSGGLDSRFIAAVSKKLNLDVKHVTYYRENGANDLDVESAKLIARSLEISDSHELFPLGEMKNEDLEELINNKRGFNYLAMGFITDFLKLSQKFNWSLITGDGGGRFISDHILPYRKIFSKKELLDQIIMYNSMGSLKDVAALTGIKEHRMLNYLAEHINQYPVRKLDHLYSYFMIREVGVNWDCEGDDRNRNYSWCTSPYYHPQLISLALSIKSKQRRHGRLYNELFKRCPGDLQEISNPNWQNPPSQYLKTSFKYFKQKLKTLFPKKIINMREEESLEHFEKKEELLKRLEEERSQIRFNKNALPTKAKHKFYWQLLTLLWIDVNRPEKL